MDPALEGSAVLGEGADPKRQGGHLASRPRAVSQVRHLRTGAEIAIPPRDAGDTVVTDKVPASVPWNPHSTGI